LHCNEFLKNTIYTFLLLLSLIIKSIGWLYGSVVIVNVPSESWAGSTYETHRSICTIYKYSNMVKLIFIILIISFFSHFSISTFTMTTGNKLIKVSIWTQPSK
jgi:hypothetical protein